MSSWTRNPFRWLDPDDYLNAPRASARTLVNTHLRDMLVSRHTELTAYANLLAVARANVDVDMLTRKQTRTDILMEEAILHGVPPRGIVRYVADREGVTVQAIYQRMKRMRGDNINVSALTFNLGRSALVSDIDTRINKRSVDAWMRSNAVVCVVCSKNRAPAGRFLCLECHTRHKPEYPAWVDKLVSEARRQHRSDARFALMRADELDSDIA